MIRFYIAGVSLTQLALFFYPFIFSGVFISAISYNKKYIKYFLLAYTVGMVLNAIVVLDPSGYLRNRISLHTFQGTQYFSVIGDFGYRLTGFHAAPGVMSLFAVIGLSISMVMILTKEKRVKWIILALSSFLCGIMTANRSFIVGICILFIMLILSLLLENGISIKKGLQFFVILILYVSAISYAWNYTTFGKRMAYRFSQEKLERDIATRTVGNASAIKSLQALNLNPLFGSLYIVPSSGAVLVWNGKEIIRPHNGVSKILSTRGLVLGLPFLIFITLSIKNLCVCGFNKFLDTEDRLLARAFFIASVTGNAVCLTDSLIETTPMLMCISYGFLCVKLTKKNYFKKKLCSRPFNQLQ
ncbi:MAG: hypothetical protein ACFFBD_04325 [Candidatus Hodarchaeota archaeon]